jgi:hypothetical protein
MNIDRLKKRRAEILKEIHSIGPFLDGSLCATKKRCGNPKCRCAKQGPIHETVLLTWKEDGTTQTLYVPKDLREEVGKLVEQYSRLREQVKLMSRTQREILIASRHQTTRRKA